MIFQDENPGNRLQQIEGRVKIEIERLMLQIRHNHLLSQLMRMTTARPYVALYGHSPVLVVPCRNRHIVALLAVERLWEREFVPLWGGLDGIAFTCPKNLQPRLIRPNDPRADQLLAVGRCLLDSQVWEDITLCVKSASWLRPDVLPCKVVFNVATLSALDECYRYLDTLQRFAVAAVPELQYFELFLTVEGGECCWLWQLEQGRWCFEVSEFSMFGLASAFLMAAGLSDLFARDGEVEFDICDRTLIVEANERVLSCVRQSADAIADTARDFSFIPYLSTLERLELISSSGREVVPLPAVRVKV